MKISKDKLEQSRKVEKPIPKPEVKTVVQTKEVVVDNTSKEVSESINRLVEVINNKSFNGAEEVSAAIKAVSDQSDKKYLGVINFLGDKIEKVAERMSNRPTAFEFDVQRNHNGFIDKILVKPAKE